MPFSPSYKCRQPHWVFQFGWECSLLMHWTLGLFSRESGNNPFPFVFLKNNSRGLWEWKRRGMWKFSWKAQDVFQFPFKKRMCLTAVPRIYGALGSKIRDQAAFWDPFAEVQVENMQSSPHPGKLFWALWGWFLMEMSLMLHLAACLSVINPRCETGSIWESSTSKIYSSW